MSCELGMTPIHLAAREGHILIVNFLLNEGVPMDAKNKKMETPYDLVNLITRMDDEIDKLISNMSF